MNENQITSGQTEEMFRNILNHTKQSKESMSPLTQSKTMEAFLAFKNQPAQQQAYQTVEDNKLISKEEIQSESQQERKKLMIEYNFSTAKTLENTIQKQIQQGKKLEEFVKIGDELGIKLQNKSSKLRLRDDNGDIIQALAPGTKIYATGASKIEANERTFLQITTTIPNGETITGWLPADFLETKTQDVTQSTPIIQDPENNIQDNNTITNNISSHTNTAREKFMSYLAPQEYSPIPEKPSESFLTKTKNFSKSVLEKLFGEKTALANEQIPQNITLTENKILDINGKQFDINNTSTDDIKNMMYDNLNTAEKDTLQEMMNTMKPLFDKVSQIENVITIWSNKALQVKENLLFKTRRKDGTIIQTNVDDIQIKLADLFSILAQGDSPEKMLADITSKREEIFNIMEATEKLKAFNQIHNINIIGVENIGKIRKLLASPENKETQMIHVYHLMRSSFQNTQGNSTDVQESLSNDLLEDPEFKHINDIINNPDILKDIVIQYNSTSEPYISPILEETLGHALAEKILNIIIENKNIENTAYEPSRDNVGHTKENKSKETLNHIEEINYTPQRITESDIPTSSVLNEAKKEIKYTLLKEYLAKQDFRGNKKQSYKGLYANIIGLSEKKSSGDTFTYSDTTKKTTGNLLRETAQLLIPIGASLKLARMGYRCTRFIVTSKKASNIITKSGMFGKIATKIPESVYGASVKGMLFYETMNISESILHGNSIKDGSVFGDASGKEWLKSALFFFAIRPLYHGIDNVLIKGISSNALRTLAEIPLKGLTTAGIGSLIERRKLTPEEAIKVTLLVAMFKGFYSSGAKTKTRIKQKTIENKTKTTREKRYTALRLKAKLKAKLKSKLKNNNTKLSYTELKNSVDPKTLAKIGSQGQMLEYEQSLEQSQTNLEIVTPSLGVDINRQKLQQFLIATFKYFTFKKLAQENGDISYKTLGKEISFLEIGDKRIVPNFNNINAVTYTVVNKNMEQKQE